MQDTRWDHALKVTGGGTGLVGHAGRCRTWPCRWSTGTACR